MIFKVKYNLRCIIEQVDRKVLENFSEQINEQMKKYLGEKIVDILMDNFSASTYDSKVDLQIYILKSFYLVIT